MAAASGVSIEIDEAATPIRDEVKGFCEILGLDPLYLANEGKLVAVLPAEEADAALAAMRAHPLGAGARVIGQVGAGEPGRVTMRTSVRRQPDRRHAGRRAAPKNLLKGPICTSSASRRISSTIVAEAARGRRGAARNAGIGKLSGVMPDAIAFCFDVVAKGTPLEGAKLEILEVEGRARCSICGVEFATPTLFTHCPCGSRRHIRLRGEELNVKTMELEID